MKPIAIAHRLIGPDQPPFIVAEMSGNHNQSLERALEIVDAAATAGVHGLKIQTYTAETMTIDSDKADFFISDADSLWQGNSLHALYQKAYTPWEWHQPIFERCQERGLIGFSTPFDATAVDFLETLAVPCYKIASFENTDLPLIRKVAATGKPVIISTGMATVAELDETVQVAREAGCHDLILLKCTSTYPAEPDSINLATIPHLQSLFQAQVGLSDHTLGIGVGVASVALGVTFVEKHFTLSRAAGGVDSAFSAEPAEMSQLVTESEKAWRAMGKISYGPTAGEKKSFTFRRSLYVVKDVEAGDLFTPDNLKSIRPGYGLPPKYLPQILGRTAKVDIEKGTAMTWDLL
ncbi:MAG: pseudaminic acid synthase [Cyanobacteria bacterium J06648_16]